MNRHSFWCDVNKNNPCDCGFAWIEQARHLLLEIYNSGVPFIDTGYWECWYCNQEVAEHMFNQNEHHKQCEYLKLHKFLEQHNELPQ